ncbi:MAG: alpha/beta hydrolase family esterase [Mycobacteriaceae bacterium]
MTPRLHRARLKRVLVALAGVLVVALGLSSAEREPTAAPHAPPALARAANGEVSLDFGGLVRSYLLMVPPTPTGPLPLVVLLHGAFVTGSAEAARTGFGTLSASGAAVVVAPESHGPAWNSGAGCCGAAVIEHVDDLAFVQSVIKDASARASIDPARVYLVGYSSGGKLAYNVACSDRPRLAGVAVFGAGPQLPCDHPAPISYVVGYGADDPNEPVHGAPTNTRGVHPALTDTMQQLRARAECSAVPSSRRGVGPADVTSWESCGQSARVTQIVWRGNTHVWPGSQPGFPESASGMTLFWPLLQRADRV